MFSQKSLMRVSRRKLDATQFWIPNPEVMQAGTATIDAATIDFLRMIGDI